MHIFARAGRLTVHGKADLASAPEAENGFWPMLHLPACERTPPVGTNVSATHQTSHFHFALTFASSQLGAGATACLAPHAGMQNHASLSARRHRSRTRGRYLPATRRRLHAVGVRRVAVGEMALPTAVAAIFHGCGGAKPSPELLLIWALKKLLGGILIRGSSTP